MLPNFISIFNSINLLSQLMTSAQECYINLFLAKLEIMVAVYSVISATHCLLILDFLSISPLSFFTKNEAAVNFLSPRLHRYLLYFLSSTFLLPNFGPFQKGIVVSSWGEGTKSLNQSFGEY